MGSGRHRYNTTTIYIKSVMSISVQFLWQGAAPWDSLAINIGIFDKKRLSLLRKPKPQQSPSETYIGQNFLFHKFEMNWSDLIDMVLLSQNIITSLSVEEVVQCSLPCTKKIPLLSKQSLNPSVTKCQRLSPATTQAHKRGLNSRQMVVDGEHCEHARSSARPSSVVTLRENNRPCRS